MKCILIFVICFTAQNFVVASRTIDDILEDFEPIFNEIHKDIGNAQTISHGEIRLQEQTFQSAIFEQNASANTNLQAILNDIRQHAKQVLSDKNLNEDSKIIEACISNQKEETTFLSRDSYVGVDVCAKLGHKTIQQLNTNSTEFYDIQLNMHYELEDIKKKTCKDSKSPLEMQSCLIQQLYFVSKPQVKEMEAKMYELLESHKNFLNKSLDYVKHCYSVVSEETFNIKISINKKFEDCVAETLASNR